MQFTFETITSVNTAVNTLIIPNTPLPCHSLPCMNWYFFAALE